MKKVLSFPIASSLKGTDYNLAKEPGVLGAEVIGYALEIYPDGIQRWTLHLQPKEDEA